MGGKADSGAVFANNAVKVGVGAAARIKVGLAGGRDEGFHRTSTIASESIEWNFPEFKIVSRLS